MKTRSPDKPLERCLRFFVGTQPEESNAELRARIQKVAADLFHYLFDDPYAADPEPDRIDIDEEGEEYFVYLSPALGGKPPRPMPTKRNWTIRRKGPYDAELVIHRFRR